MTDSSRIDDLRRRLHEDPASIAFALLAEELRRSGQLRESVDVSRGGLTIHPGYLSARVTLGRALLELGLFDEARLELNQVLQAAPDNLAALRALAEALDRQGASREALIEYRAALRLAPNDPELEHAVTQLVQTLTSPPRDAAQERASQLLGALEQWLAAIHVTRADRRA